MKLHVREDAYDDIMSNSINDNIIGVLDNLSKSYNVSIETQPCGDGYVEFVIEYPDGRRDPYIVEYYKGQLNVAAPYTEIITKCDSLGEFRAEIESEIEAFS